MRIAVAGGSGTVGRHVVTSALGSGHHPIVLSRSEGVDLLSGDGLDARLEGIDAIVDVTNVNSIKRDAATTFFTRIAQNLQEAGERAGVRHLVLLSIIGIDRVDYGYYQAKLAQEQVAASGPLPTSILRATQFHEFAGQMLDKTSGPVALVPTMRIQPVAAREVAQALVALADGGAVGYAPELAGPQEESLGDMARRVLRARGSHRLLVPVRLPGKVGRAMAHGEQLPTHDGPRGRVRFADWLAESQESVGEARA